MQRRTTRARATQVQRFAIWHSFHTAGREQFSVFMDSGLVVRDVIQLAPYIAFRLALRRWIPDGSTGVEGCVAFCADALVSWAAVPDNDPRLPLVVVLERLGAAGWIVGRGRFAPHTDERDREALLPIGFAKDAGTCAPCSSWLARVVVSTGAGVLLARCAVPGANPTPRLQACQYRWWGGAHKQPPCADHDNALATTPAIHHCCGGGCSQSCSAMAHCLTWSEHGAMPGLFRSCSDVFQTMCPCTPPRPR